MTDQTPKVAPMANVGAMGMTAVGSAAIGDQVGDALAKILAWVIAIDCQCVPPPDIIGAVHTLTVALVVAFAFGVHYFIAKKFQ